MSDLHPPLLQALEEPLPAEVAGRRDSWLTRYRRYPVYSRAWARGRLKVFGLGALALLLVALTPVLSAAPSSMPLGGVIQLALQLTLPVLLGPWLCARLRGRGLAPEREWWALATTLVALVVALLAINEWGAEPMKQWLAESTGAVDETGKRKRVVALLALNEWGAEPMKQWVAESTGAVDETGKRKRVVMAIGVSVSSPEDAAKPPRAGVGDEASLQQRLMNLASGAALSFWLAGGAGLWAWRRERDALASLARERELARALVQRREAELQLSVLAAQVEPHFLFNTLAGVRSAIRTDPGRASDMIDHLVDYLRAAIPRLRGDGGAEATLGGQLEIVRAYLALMRGRMPRLSFAIDVATDLLRAPCPPLMLISLAENAVKHGAEPKIGPVQISVSAQRSDEGDLAITVTDDGAGFDAQRSASGGGLGLSNIRQRLQQMHGSRASLTLRAGPAGGVQATLRVPIDSEA